MSEKRFSTDEIVATVMKWRGWDMDAVDEPAYKEIIARLQAADRLCEAAKGLVSSCTPELYDEYFEATKKAIADYEEGRNR